MKVAVGADHGGYVLKEAVEAALKELGAEVVDLGCFGAEVSVDYPEYGLKAAQAVASGQCDLGVVMCGTGIGISIAANKVPGVRCAVVTNEFMAEMTKRHNDANMIALGGRVITPEYAKELVKIWYNAQFEGGRHQRRIDQISDIEAMYGKHD